VYARRQVLFIFFASRGPLLSNQRTRLCSLEPEDRVRFATVNALLIVQGLIERAVCSVVENPSQVLVSHRLEGTGAVTFEVAVAPTDMGRVVGRRGTVIGSVRTLARIVGARHGLQLKVVVIEHHAEVNAPS
jgi:predicted RNA-binding protein YlqC (UPF0109 family)